MARITFFEKTGCINNTKQKNILKLAGHEVNAINLIQYDWTAEELLMFFKDLEPNQWFNMNAPSVQTGTVDPVSYTKEEALKALLSEHLLIKRPLLIIGDKRLVGFDADLIDKLVGINPKKTPQISRMLSENLEDCPQKAKNTSCD